MGINILEKLDAQLEINGKTFMIKQVNQFIQGNSSIRPVSTQMSLAHLVLLT